MEDNIRGKILDCYKNQLEEDFKHVLEHKWYCKKISGQIKLLYEIQSLYTLVLKTTIKDSKIIFKAIITKPEENPGQYGAGQLEEKLKYYNLELKKVPEGDKPFPNKFYGTYQKIFDNVNFKVKEDKKEIKISMIYDLSKGKIIMLQEDKYLGKMMKRAGLRLINDLFWT